MYLEITSGIKLVSAHANTHTLTVSWIFIQRCSDTALTCWHWAQQPHHHRGKILSLFWHLHAFFLLGGLPWAMHTHTTYTACKEICTHSQVLRCCHAASFTEESLNFFDGFSSRRSDWDSVYWFYIWQTALWPLSPAIYLTPPSLFLTIFHKHHQPLLLTRSNGAGIHPILTVFLL